MGLIAPTIASASQADPVIKLHAEVSANLREVTGTIANEPHADRRLIDTLSRLPPPATDLASQRTWPAVPENGHVTLSPTKTGHTQAFQTDLPRRFGASGTVPGDGLFAHGLWHPQPVTKGKIEPVQWEAQVTLPPGAIGVLNNTVGTGTLKWSGTADRLSLAVIPGGQMAAIHLGGQPVTLVHPPGTTKRLKTALSHALPPEAGPKLDGPIVVVVAPMRRRLTRSGAGVVYVSDRAARLSLGLWRHHTRGLQRGLVTASINNTDPWARAIVGSHRIDQAPDGPRATDTLKWLSWIPEIDALLYDGSLPFNSDIMGHIWPSDPVQDDVLEFINQTTPGAVASMKLSGLLGATEMATFVQQLTTGASIEAAAQRAQADLSLIDQWRRTPPKQNLALHHSVSPAGTHQLSVVRDTSPSAPPEPIEIQVNGATQLWRSGPGSDQITIDHTEPTARAQVDPKREVRQTRRDDDGWPPRWTPTFAMGFSEVDLRATRPSVSLHSWLRRKYGTRWVYGAHVGTSHIDIASAGVSINRSLGPLVNQRSRLYQVWLSARGSLLDPAFRPTDLGAHAIDTQVGIGRDNQDAWPLPRRGHRLYGTVGMGLVPQSTQRWGHWSTSATGLHPLGARLVLAGRGTAGMSLGGIPHRLRSLGGTGRVQAVATDAVLGHTTLTAATELRLSPIQAASVPLPLAWGTHLQLSGGLETGHAITDTGSVTATGWTAGIAGVADLLGARPGLLGVWCAAPIPPLSVGLEPNSPVQVRLRFVQAY